MGMLAALTACTLPGCIEPPDEKLLRPPAELNRVMEALGGRSAGAIAGEARRGSEQLARRSARLTAPVLARAIRHGESQAVRAGAKPIPADMQKLLMPHFKPETLSATRWTIGTGRVDLGAIIAEQFMDEGAIALNRQVVFSSTRLTENVWMWAHELAHVKNRDTLIMTMVATIAGAVSMRANFGLFFRDDNRNPWAAMLAVFVAPFAAMIVQMAISRTREFGADRGGAEISGKPLALASALARISNQAQRIPNPVVERNPAAAQLYIVPSGVRALFSTHPDTGDRIAALEAIAREQGSAPPPPRRGSALDPLGRG